MTKETTMATATKINQLLSAGFGSKANNLNITHKHFGTVARDRKPAVGAILIDANIDGTITNPLYLSLFEDYPEIAEHFQSLTGPVTHTSFKAREGTPEEQVVHISFSKRSRYNDDRSIVKDDPKTGLINLDLFKESIGIFLKDCAANSIKNVHVPQLCSGKGGMPWDTVELILQEACDEYGVHVTCHVKKNRA